MEGIIVLIGLLVIGVPVTLFIWLGVKATGAARGVENLESRFVRLQEEMRALRQELRTRGPAAPPTAPAAVVPVAPAPQPVAPAAHVVTPPAPQPTPPPVPQAPRVPRPPPTPPPVRVPAVAVPRETGPAPEPEKWMPSFNLEQFMGVKLFAWVGGFVLFLGLVFFLKLAFENQWISPEVQVAIEYLIGVGLLVGGLWLRPKRYAVLSQTLCATSVLALYAVTFAAHGYYRLMGIQWCFGVMVLVTAVAFLLAVRLDAQVVAILGLLGGFLTPVLLSTGQDNPVGLFSYIALLDAGLVAVVVRKRWNHVIFLAALGTFLMQILWVGKFFPAAKDHIAMEAYIAMGVFLGFEALFLLAFVYAEREDPWISASAIGMALVPLGFTFYLLSIPELSRQPWIIFTFVLVADLGLLTLVLLRGALAPAHLAGGGLAFLLLAIWTVNYVSGELLNWALGFYLLFAILHTAFPIVLQRLRPGAAPVWWGHLFPPVALVLVMIPIVKLPELSMLVWVCVLMLDVVVFVLALVTASILAILGALVLTLGAAALWILNVPAVVGGVSELLVVVGGFALVFFVVGVVAARRILPKAAGSPSLGLPSLSWLPTLSGDVRAQIPAFSAVLPFLLLIMVVARMPLADPSPVFGLAMLLVVLLLGVARWTDVDLLTAVGLGCAVALEYAWHTQRFHAEFAVVPLLWYLAFVVVFTVFPFMCRKAMENKVVPWAVAALAGPVHFTLVYRVVNAAWPNPAMGLLPAVFALPPLVGLVYLLRAIPATNARRLSLLAWFGGATLFFVTLIFPIQFERQWITIGWALEGVALLWLFHRVPHPGLRLVGVALLAVAFARLSLNQAVLTYHHRSAMPILNWYLYAYGIAVVCQFAGAKLLAPPRQQVLGVNAPALLATLGTVLAFLLVNIEIADYFTEPGAAALTFQFSGHFGRDMTYSIAWALFALTLLLAGIAKKLPAPRYASLALLTVTLLKLGFHDLARLEKLYRIGALIGVAVILLVSSFLYQRFVPPETKTK